MGSRLNRIKDWWKREKSTSRFRNLLRYVIFVAIATLFWFVLALNDNVQHSLDVAVRINGVPDSVTFISDIPSSIHVTVRDKGTGLLRSTFLRKRVLAVQFDEFTKRGSGVLSVSRAEMIALMRRLFGSTAQVSALSIDSLRLVYTDHPGKRVPIDVKADVTAAPGSVVVGKARLSSGYTMVYGPQETLDTIMRISTDRIVRRNISETTSVETQLSPIAGTRFIPDQIKVTFSVEPLVNKREMIDVIPVNTPESTSVILFPQRVEVSYYVPMSKFNAETKGIEIVADYLKRGAGIAGRIPVKLLRAPAEYVNVSVAVDSLEYTVMK